MLRSLTSQVTFSLMVLASASVWGQLPGTYTLAVSDETVALNDTVSVEITLDTSQGGAIDAWRYGVCHNRNRVTLHSVNAGSTTATVNNGGLPWFYSGMAYTNGFTQAVVIDLFGAISIPPATGYQLEVVIYEGISAGTANLTLCDTLGNPPITAWVVLAGVTEVPIKDNGSIVVTAGGTQFVRGDCNDDGAFNIADAVTALSILFGGAISTCDDACDVNNDGAFNIADAVTLLSALFQAGSDPAAPFPNCGTESDSDMLTCDSFASCP